MYNTVIVMARGNGDTYLFAKDIANNGKWHLVGATRCTTWGLRRELRRLAEAQGLTKLNTNADPFSFGFRLYVPIETWA